MKQELVNVFSASPAPTGVALAAGVTLSGTITAPLGPQTLRATTTIITGGYTFCSCTATLQITSTQVPNNYIFYTFSDEIKG